MKNPPLLADALIGLSLRRNMHPTLVRQCRAVLPARKFVLDEAMSRYWAEMEMKLAGTGSLKKQHRVLDLIRAQSRLPHALMWLEVDPRPYRDQTVKFHGFKLKPGRSTITRRGWLLQQHPQIDTAFRCAEYSAIGENMEHLEASYFDWAWCCNETTPLPWPVASYPADWNRQKHVSQISALEHEQPTTPEDYIWSVPEMLTGMRGYKSPQVCLLNSELVDFAECHPRSFWKLRATARMLWMLLSTINDLPVTLKPIVPSKGYVARGAYRKFLAHSIIHLTVPETKWRKLMADTLSLLRRRAHQVRGHWRSHWQHPLAAKCVHEFDEAMVCSHCGGHKIWIPEHVRGDARLGFVTHDYEVHHKVEP
jgi:hypothetical protein